MVLKNSGGRLLHSPQYKIRARMTCTCESGFLWPPATNLTNLPHVLEHVSQAVLHKTEGGPGDLSANLVL